jgi:hypothetical protein
MWSVRQSTKHGDHEVSAIFNRSSLLYRDDRESGPGGFEAMLLHTPCGEASELLP